MGSRRARADASATQASGHTTPLCASVQKCLLTALALTAVLRNWLERFALLPCTHVLQSGHGQEDASTGIDPLP